MYDNPVFRKDEGDGEDVQPPPYPEKSKRSRVSSPPKLTLNDVTEISDDSIKNNDTNDQLPAAAQSPEK